MDAFAFVSISDCHPHNRHQSCSANEVVLVTGPRCLREEADDGVIQVEATTCENIKLSPYQPRSIRQLNLPTASSLSYFGAKEEDTEELEMELQEGTYKQQPFAEEHTADPSREHGYKYEYTIDECDDQTLLLDLDMTHVSKSFMGLIGQQEEQQYATIHLLGKAYHPIHDYTARQTDESSLLWFTYRCDFPEISPYRITTDAGWGCMLRSAQMMLGQVLRMHFKTRSWQPPLALAKRKMDPFLRSLLTWFADYPSRQDCVFSLHNMVAAGLAKYDVLPGEWYGPGTAAYVMRDLVELYEQQRQQHANTEPIFRVYVASQGTVYKDAVNHLMSKQAQDVRSKDTVQKGNTEPLHPLDPLHIQDDVFLSTQDLAWDTSLLLLIPLRLGLKSFNTDYTTGLAHMFSLPQSVGVLGGRPRGARWFYGASADGKLYGLDPHTIQMAPQRRRVTNKAGKTTFVVALTDDYLRSVHTTNPETMVSARVDPSLALGFYCKNRADFVALCHSLEVWNKANPKTPELFTMADTVLDYSANLSSAMHEMMLSMNGEDDDGSGHVSDEDEYVLL
jgi:cysteine protease ATG4